MGSLYGLGDKAMQLRLRFPREEYIELKDIVKNSYKEVKKKYPQPVAGESFDEYKEFILDEVLLEISDRLRSIALRKQNERIAYFYKQCEKK